MSSRGGVSGERAFSLVELLVVLVIVLIIAYLERNHLTVATRNRALADCSKNLQKIYLSLTLYSNDNGHLPVVEEAHTSAEALSLLVPKDTTMTEIFICPGSKDSTLSEGEPFGHKKISYAYYMGALDKGPAEDPLLSDAQINTTAKHKGDLVFSTNGDGLGNNHNKFGGNIQFRDGSVVQSKPRAGRDLLFPANVRLLNPE